MAQVPQVLGVMECVHCCEEVPLTKFNTPLSPLCLHNRRTCNLCLDRTVAVSIEKGMWASIQCPEVCHITLTPEDLFRVLEPRSHTFKLYDERITRDSLLAMPEYQDCLNPRCGSGQLYPSGADPKAQCLETGCGQYICTHHKIPWHEDETCDQYEARMANHPNGENKVLSETEVRRTTKSCPSCTKPFHKIDGCEHITCPCGHQSCYVCLQDYLKPCIGFHLDGEDGEV